MSDVALIPEVVVPAEALTTTLPNPTQTQAEATTDFIAKYRAQEAAEKAGGDKEPETVVPAVDAPEVPVETPEGEVPATPEGEVKPEVESKFRNPDGTFAKAIKAKFGETDFEVPEGLMIPLKRGDTVTMKPLAEVLKEGMLYNDYNQSKQEVSEERKQGRVEVATAKAEAEVWKAITKEILDNPGKAMKYRNDPELANLWADAAEGRLVQARTDAMTRTSQEVASDTTVATIKGWAEAMAGEFPGVDPRVVLADYGTFLQQPGAAEDPGAISMDRLRTYFSNHHQRVSAVTSPLRAEMDALKAELAALKGAKAAEAKNAATQHAVQRAKAPGVIAGQGGVAQGNTGAVTGPNGAKLSLNDAHKNFLKRY